MKNLGITLLVVGIVMTVFTGFNLVTRKKVVDMGSVQITSNEKTPVYWSPIVGGVVAAAGLLILVANKKK
jgi:formate-dependent nitrite reductase membrane component NrfD